MLCHGIHPRRIARSNTNSHSSELACWSSSGKYCSSLGAPKRDPCSSPRPLWPASSHLRSFRKWYQLTLAPYTAFHLLPFFESSSSNHNSLCHFIWFRRKSWNAFAAGFWTQTIPERNSSMMALSAASEKNHWPWAAETRVVVLFQWNFAIFWILRPPSTARSSYSQNLATAEFCRCLAWDKFGTSWACLLKPEISNLYSYIHSTLQALTPFQSTLHPYSDTFWWLIPNSTFSFQHLPRHFSTASTSHLYDYISF